MRLLRYGSDELDTTLPFLVLIFQVKNSSYAFMNDY